MASKPKRTNLWLHRLHRWCGFLCLVPVALYLVTGIALNHRRDFGYFMDRPVRQLPLAAPVDTAPVTAVVGQLTALTGEERPPTVVKIEGDGTISLLYGSHGRVTYRVQPGSATMERQEKRPWPVWTLLNRAHKAVGAGSGWLVAADILALALAVCAGTAPFLPGRRRLDWLLLGVGGVATLALVAGV